MLENRSNSGKRAPNTSHAATNTSFCNNTFGGTDVAREISAALGIKELQACYVETATSTGAVISETPKINLNTSLHVNPRRFPCVIGTEPRCNLSLRPAAVRLGN